MRVAVGAPTYVFCRLIGLSQATCAMNVHACHMWMRRRDKRRHIGVRPKPIPLPRRTVLRPEVGIPREREKKKQVQNTNTHLPLRICAAIVTDETSGG